MIATFTDMNNVEQQHTVQIIFEPNAVVFGWRCSECSCEDIEFSDRDGAIAGAKSYHAQIAAAEERVAVKNRDAYSALEDLASTPYWVKDLIAILRNKDVVDVADWLTTLSTCAKHNASFAAGVAKGRF